MKKIILSLFLCIALLTACGAMQDKGDTFPIENSYTKITVEQAKTLMDEEDGYILLDVRTEKEFAVSHIGGALLIPSTEITIRAQEELPDKDALILVYCRSGNRSKQAAQALVDMGYTNVQEFGGINDWPYEIVE